MSELRWNPLLGEWVATATHRQERTFLPPADYCPLCPTKAGGFPTEIPEPSYDIAVFENRFPSLRTNPAAPAVESSELYPVEPGRGVCEVICYSPRHDATLAEEPVEQIHKLVRVWADRTTALGELPFVQHVFPFENKGVAIGVTLHHPHGQIYGYPAVPPKVQRELDMCVAHQQRTGRCLLCDVRSEERRDGRRVVFENAGWTAYVPFFARWPYEVHITSSRHVQLLPELEASEMRDLASVLKTVLVAYDKLFARSMPYILAVHQAPSHGTHDAFHLHVEIYPPLRTAEKLKYLAGSETAAGFFINDTLAEDKAAELRALCTPAVWSTR